MFRSAVCDSTPDTNGSIMADERLEFGSFHLRELCPWTHLFRGFHIALDLKKMAFGASGALLTALGWWGILFVFGPSDDPESPATAPPHVAAAISEAQRFPWQQGAGPDVYASPFQAEGWTPQGLPTAAFLVVEPFRKLMLPARLMFLSSDSLWLGLLLSTWTVVVWAFFGGAITRIAAVQVAKDGHVGLVEAATFVAPRLLNYLAAPIVPFLGVLVLVVLSGVAGLASLLPMVNVVVGALWLFALIAGMLMALGLLGLAIGWPLMFAAVSAEASESFDAVSRVFSYLFGRFWHYLFYIVVAVFYGAVLTTIVVSCAFLAVHLSQYAVMLTGNDDSLRAFFANAPTAGGWRNTFGPSPDAAEAGFTDGIAGLLVGIWTHLFFLGVVGFAYSYFWSSTTIIYFLLRQDVDETEIEEVYVDEEEEEPFPTVAPSLGPPPEVVQTPAPAADNGDPSLPIIDPSQ